MLVRWSAKSLRVHFGIYSLHYDTSALHIPAAKISKSVEKVGLNNRQPYIKPPKLFNMATSSEQKAQPYTFDLGHMLVTDPNPLPTLTASTKEDTLQQTARGCAQALINQLLTNCPITRADDGALQLTLPTPETQLPREKHVPKEQEKTKWEKFAEKKGIKSKGKDGKMRFDEAKGDWVAKYGYKPGSGKDAGPGEWLEEIDEKAERKAKEGKEGGGKERREKKMKTRKAK